MPDAFIVSLDVFYFCVETEFHSVRSCVFCHCNIKHERADDSTCRSVKRTFYIIRKIRFHLECFFTAQNSQFFYTICDATIVQCLQSIQCFFVDAYNHSSITFERNIQIFRKLSHQFISPDIHLCHQGAFSGIKAGMDNRRICLGRSFTDVFALFQYTDVCVIARQFSGNCAACYSRANNNYVIHVSFSPFQ